MKTLEPIYQEAGKRIVGWRKHRGLSQAQLAEKIGLTRASLTNIEVGKQRVQIHTLVKICRALDIGMAAIVSADMGF